MSPRRSPKQLSLDLKAFKSHGGRRAGAGRPKSSRYQSHVARSSFRSREPLHLTLRLGSSLPSLRRKQVFRCLKHAVGKARSKGLAIVHYVVLSNHLHLIVESSDKRKLARQMQSLEISFSKRLNRLAGREGCVFEDRYHAHVLKTPTEVKNALAYVLTNEHKHKGGEGRVHIDEYSSGRRVTAAMWEKLLGKSWQRVIWYPSVEDPDPDAMEEASLSTDSPGSWLLKSGWMRAA